MQFHEMYMDKIHNHEVAGSIPAPATEDKYLKMKDLEELNLSSPFSCLSKTTNKTTNIWTSDD